jgi:hypothetical protein
MFWRRCWRPAVSAGFAVPLNFRLAAREGTELLTDSDVKLFVADAGGAQTMQDMAVLLGHELPVAVMAPTSRMEAESHDFFSPNRQTSPRMWMSRRTPWP